MNRFLFVVKCRKAGSIGVFEEKSFEMDFHADTIEQARIKFWETSIFDEYEILYISSCLKLA